MSAAARALFSQAVELGREVRAVAKQGHLIALARRSTPPPAAPPPVGDRVVVFVHGFLAAGPVFGPMRGFVEERAGVSTVDLTYLPLERFDVVVNRLESIIAKVDDGRAVDIVGHSLGGVVARWYLQERGGAARVDRLVTLATPHAGTRAAMVAPGPLVQAIRPGSEVVRRLRASRGRAARVAHTAIVAGADRVVTPPDSAASIDDAEIHWIDGVGHNEMLFDRRAFDLVHAGLSRALLR